jgi:hypothetical protein
MRSKKIVQVGILLMIAALAFLGFRQWGIAGDCSPHEVDGQCGMSSAFGSLFGILAGCVIVLVGMIGLAAKWSKQKKAGLQSPSCE